MPIVSDGARASIILRWRYPVRVYAEVCRTCAFACALKNIIQTLVACEIVHTVNFQYIILVSE